jgi:hypothetical protein
MKLWSGLLKKMNLKKENPAKLSSYSPPANIPVNRENTRERDNNNRNNGNRERDNANRENGNRDNGNRDNTRDITNRENTNREINGNQRKQNNYSIRELTD